MSWASIANNQCVSQANLQDAIATGVFVLKNAFGSTNEQVTTSEAENWVCISSISKLPNQLVVKSDLVKDPAILSTWTWTDNTNAGGVFEIFVNSVLVVQQFGAGNTGLYSGSYPVSICDAVSVNVTSYGNPSTGTEALLYIENPNGTIIFNSGSSTPLPNISQSISYSFAQAATSVVNGFSNNV